jgi:hypothetical protein
MSAARFVSLLLLAAAPVVAAHAHSHGVPAVPGPLVSVTVEIDGEPATLFPAPDGSGRFYLEAREGRTYSLRLANHSAERLGVVLTVDGLNVISGQRDEGRGRMYILDPWQSTHIRGWRSSLHEVHRFTFVDERASYSARSGKANRKMGWIELAVYRERDAIAMQPLPPPAPRWREPLDRHEREKGETTRDEAKRSARSDEAPAASAQEGAARSYPGTGWGQRTHDPARLVDFRPERHACQRTTLRYEYRPALVALGVLPCHPPIDRLHQRDRAESGFAPPPLW